VASAFCGIALEDAAHEAGCEGGCGGGSDEVEHAPAGNGVGGVGVVFDVVDCFAEGGGGMFCLFVRYHAIGFCFFRSFGSGACDMRLSLRQRRSTRVFQRRVLGQ